MDEYLTFDDGNLAKNHVTRVEVKQVLQSDLSTSENLRGGWADMALKKRLTAQDRLERVRQKAKKELAVKGTVQFRLDEESMLRLMRMADKKKLPLGTLVRMWTVERMDAESARSER